MKNKRNRYIDEIVLAVDALGEATVTDVQKLLTSSGIRLSPKTIVSGLKKIRQYLAQPAKRRSYALNDSLVIRSRRTRRKKQGKPKCPCFSKASHRSAARRYHSRRRRIARYANLQARRNRRASRRRRSRRRTFNMEHHQRLGTGIVARRHRRKNLRRRRHTRRRDVEEDSKQNVKTCFENNNKNSSEVQPIKNETTTDSAFKNDLEESSNITTEEGVNEKEHAGETKSQSDKENEDIQSEGTDSEEGEQTREEKSEEQGEGCDESATMQTENENENEDFYGGYENEEDEYEYDMY